MDIDRPKKASLIKVRFVIVILATLCPVVCYISRQNLPLAIVAMVEDSQDSHHRPQHPAATNQTLDQDHHSNVQHQAQCPAPTETGADGQLHSMPVQVTYGPKYAWSQSDRGWVLGAFFYTYVIFQIPAARFAEIIGAKWILATAGIGSCVLSLISPLACSVHVYLFILVRALMGVCQTALYPAGYVLYTQWLPPTERSLALPILVVGAYLGSIITSTATGYFSEKESYGWTYAYYMPGILCGCWSVLWLIFASSEPRDHKSISLEELEYIELRTGAGQKVAAGSSGGLSQTKKRKRMSPSWIKIFKSQHIWAMIAAFFASNWAFTITLLLLPSYLNHILLIPPFRNGLINSLLYILFCVASPIVGAIAALMVETRPFGMSHLQVRKFFQCTAVFSQAICFLLLPAIGCNTDLALYLCYVQIVLFSFVNGGEVQLPSDLSVDFAGTIYAIGNCFGSATGFIVPFVHSLIVHDNKDKDEWKAYFYVASGVTSLGGLIFLIFGRNDLQDFSSATTSSQVCDVEGVSVEKDDAAANRSSAFASIKLDTKKPKQITI